LIELIYGVVQNSTYCNNKNAPLEGGGALPLVWNGQ